jgi:hypothetical protein
VIQTPWVSNFVVDVVVGVGEVLSDLIALVMQEEYGRGC